MIKLQLKPQTVDCTGSEVGCVPEIFDLCKSLQSAPNCDYRRGMSDAVRRLTSTVLRTDWLAIKRRLMSSISCGLIELDQLSKIEMCLRILRIQSFAM